MTGRRPRGSRARTGRAATGRPRTGRARRLSAVLALAGALFALPGCASSVDPIERLGRKAAEKVTPLVRNHQIRPSVPPDREESAPPVRATGS
ncbi:hypothetical protein [Streptomyces sp. NPDC126499]|uniref:hypothetical protein n=1 Tax=Streptomyces sp. NPDC126499 TaxID=3155314 RepID=UPI00331CB52F